jgi:hypothetical protein
MKHDRYPDLSLMSDTLRVLMNWIPDDIVLSDTTIEENRAEGTVVGILNTISRKDGDEHDFTTDLNGRMVYQKQWPQNTIHQVIDLRDLSEGNYILNYQLTDETDVRKIILK